jgi:diguanylate cyclase (GGDEF)-like protein
MARTSRSGAAVSVLFIDLDGFKSVNDRLGHAAGDEMLKLVANRIRACLRPGDTAARLGGDEFAVLMEDFRGPDDVNRVAERIAKALKQPADLKSHSVVIAASIGSAMALGRGRQKNDLLLEADKAMYEEKRRRLDRRASFERRVALDAGLAELQVGA